METREKTFNIRFSLTTDIPEALWEDEDFEEDEWLNEWEASIKPDLIRVVFSHLRRFPNWDARIRNRGISALDEIEVVLRRNCTVPGKPPDGATQ